MTIVYKGVKYAFRSKGLNLFIKLLKEKHPSSVNWMDLQQVFPHISGKQVSRFIDALEKHGLRLIEYDTKTQGPFRFCADVAQLSVSVGNTFAATLPVRQACSKLALETLLKPEWMIWIRSLSSALLCMQNADLKEAAIALNEGEIAAQSLPLWALCVVHACKAHYLARQSKYREAQAFLRRIDTAVRKGLALPNVALRAQLCRAKIYFEQGRYSESQKILQIVHDTRIDNTGPWLNIHGLNKGREYLASDGDVEKLEITLSSFLYSIADVFLMLGDTTLLDSITFNFANNLLRGIHKGNIPQEYASSVLNCLSINQFITHKFGLGEDSIYTSLVVFDIIHEFKISKDAWPKDLNNYLNLDAGLNKMLNDSLQLAQNNQHRLEIAECLLRLGKSENSHTEAYRYFMESKILFKELNRKDMLKELNRLMSKVAPSFRPAPVNPGVNHPPQSAK